MDLGDLRKILVKELGCLDGVDADVRKAIWTALASMVAPPGGIVRKTPLQICEYCGEEFEGGKKRRFCSQECYRNWERERPRETPSMGRYRGPTPRMTVIYRDAFAELDRGRWVEQQVADIERLSGEIGKWI